MKSILALLLCLTSLADAWASTTDQPPAPVKTGKLVLHFTHKVDRQDLRLNDSVSLYRNAHGDDLKITTFKYYISNILLTDKKGATVSVPDSYVLVNAADESTLRQELPGIPAGKYKTISFTIGVDSLRNFAGAQTGSLDPAKGMFWSWKTGYIYVKLEGQSSTSASKNHRLTFHIGGAIAPNNTIRTFTQQLGKTLKVDEGKQPELAIEVNAAALFSGKTIVDFSKLSNTMGGPNSVIVADNYAKGLFRIAHVKN